MKIILEPHDEVISIYQQNVYSAKVIKHHDGGYAVITRDIEKYSMSVWNTLELAETAAQSYTKRNVGE